MSIKIKAILEEDIDSEDGIYKITHSREVTLVLDDLAIDTLILAISERYHKALVPPSPGMKP